MSCGERLAQGLRDAGFRVTPQRGVILETVAHLEGHPSAQEVYEKAKQRLPGLNIATVYRTLDRLHEVGLVDTLMAGDAPVRFSLHDDGDPHGHLVCRNCGKVLSLDSELLGSLAARIADDQDFALDICHLTLVGLCGACQRPSAAP